MIKPFTRIMKKIIFTALYLTFTFALFGQPNEDDIKKTSPFIRFSPSEVNMGSISVNDVTDDTGKIDIEVWNDGSTPLILNQVTGCCGTRVSDWPRKPIVPGQMGTIKVYFRVNPTPSRISRTINIQSNAGNGNLQKIAILGEIVLPKTGDEIKLPM